VDNLPTFFYLTETFIFCIFLKKIMSRLDELKKQYPELNLTVFDLMLKFDTSKSYKYLPLICKLFAKSYSPKSHYHPDEYPKIILEMQSLLNNRGISTDNLNESEMFVFHEMMNRFNNETFTTLKDFIYYMDKNKIDNKDVTSYSSIDDMRGAVTLATMKEFSKEMSNQVVREYEDDTWIAIRPLTFPASAKYGSGTRWCTTYQREKQHFERYWRQGILCYFINKKTGYKFAGFKSLQDREMTFWNADDSRIDYLDVEIENYMFSIVKKIFSSVQSNKNLSSDEIQEQVHKECISDYEVKHMVHVDEDIMENQTVMEERIVRAMNITPVPVYEEPTLIRG
jgi:hypothetical protein